MKISKFLLPPPTAADVPSSHPSHRNKAGHPKEMSENKNVDLRLSIQSSREIRDFRVLSEGPKRMTTNCMKFRTIAMINPSESLRVSVSTVIRLSFPSLVFFVRLSPHFFFFHVCLLRHRRRLNIKFPLPHISLLRLAGRALSHS